MNLFLKKFISISLFVAFFLFMNIAYCANTSQQIKKVEQKRSVLKQKIQSLAKLEKKQTSIITKNQQQLEQNKRALKTSKKQFKETQQNLNRLQSDLNSYLVKYNEQNAVLSERIRCIYKTKHTLILDLLISAKSISKFLDRIYYQNLIISSDKNIIYKLRTEAKKTTYLKEKVEKEKRRLALIIRDMDRENTSIQSTIRQNKIILKKITEDKKAYEKSERELAKQSDYLTKMISKTTKHSSVIGVKGGFILPVQGARISSPFGYRIHPIFKSKIFHTGIDYAIAYGTPIKASNTGKVIYSGWYGGYGKVVIIDHGSCTGAPTTTLYAHMSRQNVSPGESVNQGDIIGYVGSTGYSTGPHVHFEVRINGKPQNPAKYLQGK